MKHRKSKPSRAAIKAAAKAMKPSSTVAGLKAWQGRIVTEAESSSIAVSAQHGTPDNRQKQSDDGAEPERPMTELRDKSAVRTALQ